MTKYTASSIQVLEATEAVRRRPGMYLGGRTRLEHSKALFRALLGRSTVTPAVLSRCGNRFTYVDSDPIANTSRDMEHQITSLSAHGGHEQDLGLLAVAALSEGAVFETCTGSRPWRMHTVRGKVATAPMPFDGSRRRGARVEFLLDDSDLLGDDDVLDVAWDAACACPGSVKIVFGQDVVAPNGVLDHHLLRSNPTPPIRAKVHDAEVAFVWDRSALSDVPAPDPIIRIVRPGYVTVAHVAQLLAKELEVTMDDLLPGLRVVVAPPQGSSRQAFAELHQAIALAVLEHRRVWGWPDSRSA